ncbi:MAG TPA: GtrA family protein [Dongiaceae bacterium]|jgi:putative flippase GtrA|nr:GtrA family protein [Dongiaceae bacterium]
MTPKIPVRTHPHRAAAFVGIGAINTAIDISAFACFYQVVGLDVISSNVLAFLIAATNSYTMNFLITFADRHSKRGTLRSFARFLFVAVISMSVSTVIVYLISMVTHPLIAKLIATAASTMINYLGSYWFVFSGGTSAEPRTSVPSE